MIFVEIFSLCDDDGPMKNIKFALAVLVLATVLVPFESLFAQPRGLGTPAQDAPFKEFSQQGSLFSLKIVPAGAETHLYLVGTDGNPVKFEKLSVTGHIKVGEEMTPIEFHKDKDHFVTKQSIHGHPLHLKAKDEESKNTEEFHVELKKP